MSSDQVARAVRVSLWVFLVPASLIAADYLIVGLTFGSNLWKMSDLRPTLLWLAVVGLPLFLIVGLRQTRRSSRASLYLFAGTLAYIIACLAVWFRLT